MVYGQPSSNRSVNASPPSVARATAETLCAINADLSENLFKNRIDNILGNFYNNVGH